MSFYNFDYGSSRPVYPEVLEMMSQYFLDKHGNPSSVHKKGRESHAHLEEARELIKGAINGRDGKLIFTSGATEANNLAIMGICKKFLAKDTRKKPQLITSVIEHVSVFNVFNYLEKLGFQVNYLPVDSDGMVDLDVLKDAISEKTALVSVMYASQEVGTLQPVEEIARIAAENGAVFHTDAAAAFGRVKVDVEKTGISMMTIASNDIYGPPGVGALYVEQGRAFEPLFSGGPQEFKKRPGTESLPLVMGFKSAVKLTMNNFEKETGRLRKLQAKLIGELTQIKAAHLNGHLERRVPDNVNVRFSYIEGEAMLLHLENQDILVATGSACTSDRLQASRVLTSMGIPHEEAHGSLQLTLGKDAMEDGVNRLLEALPPIVEQLRMMSPLTPDDFFD